MTVRDKRFRSASRAIAFLDALVCRSGSEFLFRGETGSERRLKTTMDRYWAASHVDEEAMINKMIRQYKDGLSRMGRHLPTDMTALDCLEHARHHGLPAPLLDFSWSPYIALFFSVNGVGHRRTKSDCVLYALNLNQLAVHWVLHETRATQDSYPKSVHAFLHSSKSLRDAFPRDHLAVIRDPGPYSRRMQNQLGAFIFCTLNYASRGCRDFEAYLGRIDEAENRRRMPAVAHDDGPVLTKVIIKVAWAPEIFQRLELLGITGAKLFEDAEGVAADVCNAVHYVPKTAFLRRDVDRT